MLMVWWLMMRLITVFPRLRFFFCEEFCKTYVDGVVAKTTIQVLQYPFRRSQAMAKYATIL
jgi:hypothetical protein